MFATGLQPLALAFFTAATMMIAVPNGVQVFGWLTTLATGRPRWAPPLLFVAGFIVIFVAGGLTGVMLAAVPFNWQAHDSYFVVGHFHYVLIGGVIFPMFAALYYWLPKITGRRLHDRLGQWNFWLMFVFFNLTFFPMHLAGLAGMPRRVYTYGESVGWGGYNALSTIGAFGFGAAVLLLVVNVVWSLRKGPPAERDPWGGDTLEWTESSPPAEAQYPELPVVRSRHPAWEQTSLAPEDPELARTLAPLHVAPTGWRGGLVVSALEGRPLAIVHLPGPSLVPFVVSVGFVGLLAAALIDSPALALVGALVTAGGVVGWYWPRASERLAIAELGEAQPGRLPLAVVGPIANGWWATCVLLLVLGTALVTLVASYFYLGDGALGWAPATPPGGPPLGGIALLGLASGAMVWARSTIGGARVARRRLALAATFGAVLAFVLLTLLGYRAMNVPSDESAYGSIVLGLLGFQWLVAGLLLVMLAIAQLWAWLAPADPRGHGVLANTSLVGHFTLVSWLVVAGTLYLTPRLG
jgi:cytochrome c oxidase subunit I+III